MSISESYVSDPRLPHASSGKFLHQSAVVEPDQFAGGDFDDGLRLRAIAANGLMTRGRFARDQTDRETPTTWMSVAGGLPISRTAEGGMP